MAAPARGMSRASRREEVVPPIQTRSLVPGQETLRQTAAHPEPPSRRTVALRGRGDFQDLEGPQFQRSQPPGETLRLPEQGRRGRPEQQEPAGPPPGAPPPVDGAANFAEEFRRVLHFVEDHEPVPVVVEEGLRILDLPPVGGRFQVQIDGVASGGDLQRQRRLAHLPRPQNGHRRLPTERCFDLPGQSSGNHPCKSYIIMSILHGFGSDRWRPAAASLRPGGRHTGVLGLADGLLRCGGRGSRWDSGACRFPSGEAVMRRRSLRFRSHYGSREGIIAPPTSGRSARGREAGPAGEVPRFAPDADNRRSERALTRSTPRGRWPIASRSDGRALPVAGPGSARRYRSSGPDSGTVLRPRPTRTSATPLICCSTSVPGGSLPARPAREGGRGPLPEQEAERRDEHGRELEQHGSNRPVVQGASEQERPEQGGLDEE